MVQRRKNQRKQASSRRDFNGGRSTRTEARRSRASGRRRAAPGAYGRGPRRAAGGRGPLSTDRGPATRSTKTRRAARPRRRRRPRPPPSPRPSRGRRGRTSDLRGTQPSRRRQDAGAFPNSPVDAVATFEARCRAARGRRPRVTPPPRTPSRAARRRPRRTRRRAGTTAPRAAGATAPPAARRRPAGRTCGEKRRASALAS